jgi:hypothetical protein
MKIIIEFNIDNDAFRHNDELAAVMDDALDKILHQLERHVTLQNPQRASNPYLLDSNGNSVGTVLVE